MIVKFKSSLIGRKLYRSRWFWIFRNAIRDLIQKKPIIYQILDDRKNMEDAEEVMVMWTSPKPQFKVGLIQDTSNPPYWTKYERFLKNNGILFEYYDIHQSNWLSASNSFDVIIWATEGKLPQIEEQKRKTYILEKYCGKNCFPSYETLMWHEDKIFQYEWLKMSGFPVIETFISYSYPEALDKVQNSQYPLVTKQPIGAGSLGVELIGNSKSAINILQQAFSPAGRATYWPYIRQKDYVYFQNFQPNEGYDLRVIVVGDKVLGYYRDVPQGEFRASGMGLVRKDALPDEAIRLARAISQKLDLVIVAVDMLRDKLGKFQIIEMSAFIQVDTAGQLHLNDVPGTYTFYKDEYHFEPGKYWIQELALKEFFERLLHKLL